MAFKARQQARRRLMLYPLMDMFFILLLFFLVTAANKEPEKATEEVLYRYSLPKQDVGESQLLIQLIDGNQLKWLDYTFIEEISSQNEVETLPIHQLGSRFSEFAGRIRDGGGGEIHIVVRCPRELAFQDVQQVKQTLTNVTDDLAGIELKFSLLEGSAGDVSLDKIQRDADTVIIDFKYGYGR